MNKEIFRYLHQNFSTVPKDVDRIFVSAFIRLNNIVTHKNKFLKEYIITEENEAEVSILQNFIAKIQIEGINFDFESLIKLFEFVISPEDRIINGAVYTPEYIRKYIVNQALEVKKNELNTIKIADISCGCGGFLYTVATGLKSLTNSSYKDIFAKQIFGLDIQEYSINRTKLLLTLLAVSKGEDLEEFIFNLHTGDALCFEWKKVKSDFSGFEIIVGNPPYVCSRNISEETKKLLDSWEVCKTGHPDLYIPFFQIGIENLAPKGFLGYITMNSFFKSLNGRALRAYFKQKLIKMRIEDFGSSQVFGSKSTYTCLCFIEKEESEYITYALKHNVEVSKPSTPLLIKYSNLDSHKGWNLQNADILNKIEETGTPFGEIFKTRNGIATLKNEIYIFEPVREDDKYYYLQNGTTYQIEKEICKEIINPNQFIETENIDSLKEKVLFPYTFSGNKAKLLDEEVFRSQFPKAYAYLEAKKNILAGRDKGNGDYENWYAFGRNQSLEKLKNKLFFPHITPKIPKYVINTDENLLFYNGIAVVAENEADIQYLKKLMSTKLFWFYIKNSSKPYGSKYYSLSRNYIKNFGICDLTETEKNFIVNENNQNEIDRFFEEKYEIKLS